jgi:indole-3-glycerol phosphate synthase
MAADILSRIVADKRQEVELAQSQVPLNHLKDAEAAYSKRRSLYNQLSTPGPKGINIIAEIKRASPSKGNIRIDLDPADYAQGYESGGARAISVLTDTPYFKGSVEDLKAARQASSLPVLRKDFIISDYQIYESAVMGADAILLIVRILSPQQLRDFLSLAQDLNLDALVEIHSEAELKTAIEAGAQIVGINNRNLKTFETNLETAIQLASQLKDDQVAVSESGIKNRDDIEHLRASGIWNFLIGESLVRARSPEAGLMELMD